MTDLFGNKVIEIRGTGKKAPKNLFTDYEGFVDKFKTKKTTDDCYTPPAVYEAILRYVCERCGIAGRTIVRPFYPGGDYEHAEYPAGCVVVDNPPFSIISQIVRFYLNRGIDFFLFAPHLTLFSADLACTRIVCGVDIIYENGAKVKTSFMSNMFGDAGIIGDPVLLELLKRINENNRANPVLYDYPPHVLTVSMVQKWVLQGIGIEIKRRDLAFCRGLDCQHRHGKAIFGSGYLLSEKAAAEKAAAEKAAAEKAAAEKRNVIKWELSSREWEIVQSLGQGE